ncbi:MAG: DJ-1/PfpI family protein [Hyphomonadaceae bacterium]|nr:DJ-1/PfpI family protein [Clostridia bacterium]
MLKIGHLYPDLLNLYGDRGNIITLKNRLVWRDMPVEVKTYGLNEDIDFEDLDILVLGGGSDREQLLVCNRLKEIKQDFAQYVESNGVVVAICGGYQLLGHYYKLENEKIAGLGVLDIYTEQGSPRLIGNVVVQTDAGEVVGFENHGGRTHIGSHTPFGKVLIGHGNNGTDRQEGVLYKNVLGTYLHGPLLPKNPQLADWLITRAIRRKDAEFEALPILQDEEEQLASFTMIERLKTK